MRCPADVCRRKLSTKGCDIEPLDYTRPSMHSIPWPVPTWDRDWLHSFAQWTALCSDIDCPPVQCSEDRDPMLSRGDSRRNGCEGHRYRSCSNRRRRDRCTNRGDKLGKGNKDSRENTKEVSESNEECRREGQLWLKAAVHFLTLCVARLQRRLCNLSGTAAVVRIHRTSGTNARLRTCLDSPRTRHRACRPSRIGILSIEAHRRIARLCRGGSCCRAQGVRDHS
jgi:hypothetical protein